MTPFKAARLNFYKRIYRFAFDFFKKLCYNYYRNNEKGDIHIWK